MYATTSLTHVMAAQGFVLGRKGLGTREKYGNRHLLELRKSRGRSLRRSASANRGPAICGGQLPQIAGMKFPHFAGAENCPSRLPYNHYKAKQCYMELYFEQSNNGMMKLTVYACKGGSISLAMPLIVSYIILLVRALERACVRLS